ncbi:MAG TPA: hypothetical protein VFS43_46330 [Polyangiaceae bacterium]|nr:hypothetical protein [Polyangiaceae bacterium]
MRPRPTHLALCFALATGSACSRNPEGSAQPTASASGPLAPFGAPAASSPAAAPPDAPTADAPKPSGSADAPKPSSSADAPKPSSSADDPKPSGSAARDPGRYRAPVVMTLRGGSGAQPGPIVVTIDVREPVQAPATLALSYPLADGGVGRKSLAVSLTSGGAQTHTITLEAGARAPVRVTLDASDPARGSGLHAERTWPEAAPPAASPPPPRTPGPPGGRPPFSKPPG